MYYYSSTEELSSMWNETSLKAYRQSREVLLTSVITELSSDERCVAAWLTGSYARNDADEVSDLDITVVIAEPYSGVLCNKQEQVSHKTTPERFALFSKFGTPALVHENNHNAPKNGTFTFVLYSGSALMVDWVLRPQTGAERPPHSILLFSKENIPVSSASSPEDGEKNRTAIAEIHAFFWMMTAVTIKYIIRGDLVFVQNWLEELHKMIREIERRMEGVSWEQAYGRGSVSQLQPTSEKQIESLRQLISRMQQLQPKITEFTGIELSAPVGEIEFLLSFADESHARD